MSEPHIIAFSILLLLLWSGAALTWLLRVAKDRARRVSTLVMVGVALAIGPFAFSKNGDPPLRSSPSIAAATNALLLVEVRTNAVFDLSMPTNAAIHTPWLRRGASDDWFWLHATNDFFRVGTNAFRSVRVSSRGTLAFPDSSLLEPFHAVLGLLPEPNWTNVPSRFWHAPVAGGGRLFTWEGTALDRDPATPVSFQAELHPDGDWLGRYDLPHHATNFAIAAFGETALSVCSGVTNAATVCRVDGVFVAETPLPEILRNATRFELVWRAAEGDPDADPDGDGLTTRDELRRYGTSPKQADTDGDGLSDAVEILLGSNPLDADEDGDGVPDGVSPAEWAANPLWATNETGNIIVSLVEAIPTNMAATFQLGDLSIPLRDPATWTFSLEPGVAYAYRLFVTDGATVNLAITNDVPRPPMRGATSWGQPLWDEGTGGVFDGPSFGGEGELAIPLATLTWDDPHDGSHGSGNSICLHGGAEAVFTPSLLPAIACDWTLEGFSWRGLSLVLSVPDSGTSYSGTAILAPGVLRFGDVTLAADAHRCDATASGPFCSVCGEYEPEDIAVVPSSRTLTLKHDAEIWLSVVHSNSPSVQFEDVAIDIRRTNATEWVSLGSVTNLSPWIARVPGHFELRGHGSVNGRTFETPVADLVVQFPSLADIITDLGVQGRMIDSWNLTKQDCTDVPNRRREHGFWIQLDTTTNCYQCTADIEGPWVYINERGSITNNPPADTNPFDLAPNAPGGTFNVCGFHTHTPTTYRSTGRYVGPSDEDISIAALRGIPSLVYDYIATGTVSNKPAIEAHCPKESDARFYPVLPSRRETP